VVAISVVGGALTGVDQRYEVILVKAASDAVGRHMAAAMNALLHRTARMRRSGNFSA
jgi:hypothetical protein